MLVRSSSILILIKDNAEYKEKLVAQEAENETEFERIFTKNLTVRSVQGRAFGD